MRRVGVAGALLLAAAGLSGEDLWPDVKKILDARCIECHGPAKSKSALRLDTPAAIAVGGQNGKVLTPGQPEASPLYGRTILADDSDDLMPPKGGRLKPEQTDLLKRWIAAGAPMGVPVPMDAAAPGMDHMAGSATAAPAKPTKAFHAPDHDLDQLGASLPEPAKPAIEALRKLGVVVTPLDRPGRALDLLAGHTQKPFTDAELALLEPLAAHVVWLDLSGTAVTDTGIATLTFCTNLRRLRLDRTAAGDQGVSALTGLPLESLNLVGTKATDASLRALATVKTLRRLFLWQTATTPEAGEKLARQIPGLDIARGSN